MDDADNPYRAPGSDDPAPDAPHLDRDDDDPREIGKAQYVPWVAVMLIIHGVLMFAAALIYVGMMIIVSPQIGQQIENQQKMQGPNAVQFSKEGWTALMYAVYGGMAACVVAIGILNIFAGIRNYGYHNRVLGIVSLVLNMGSILFCWCLPFSIGLLIFGMIIYLSPESDRAFRWRTASHEKSA